MRRSGCIDDVPLIPMRVLDQVDKDGKIRSSGAVSAFKNQQLRFFAKQDGVTSIYDAPVTNEKSDRAL
jgi:hypothetical protein